MCYIFLNHLPSEKMYAYATVYYSNTIITFLQIIFKLFIEVLS